MLCLNYTIPILLETSEICKTLENFLNQELDHSSLEQIDNRVTDYKKLSQKHSIEPDLLESKLIEIKNKLQLSEESNLNIEKLVNKLRGIEKKYLDHVPKVLIYLADKKDFFYSSNIFNHSVALLLAKQKIPLIFQRIYKV